MLELRKLAGDLAAILAKLLKRQLPAKSNSVSFDLRWPLVGRFDVLGSPVAVFRRPDGSELALDYSNFSRSDKREASPVPFDWVKALGAPIDAPRFDGLMMSRCVGSRAPLVAVGADGTVLIVTPKGAITRKKRVPGGPRWLRGVHVPVDEVRRMRRVLGEHAAALIKDSQRPFAFKTPREFGEAFARAADGALSRYLMERYGGIDDDGLPGYPPNPYGYSDAEIERSKRAAAELLDRLAAPTLTDVVKPGAIRPPFSGPVPGP